MVACSWDLRKGSRVVWHDWKTPQVQHAAFLENMPPIIQSTRSLFSQKEIYKVWSMERKRLFSDMILMIKNINFCYYHKQFLKIKKI